MATILEFSDVKSLLGLEKSEWSDYPQLQVVADSVHAAIEDHLRYTVGAVADHSHSERVRRPTNLIYLPALPVTEITSITLDGDDITSDAEIWNDGVEFSSDVYGELVVAFRAGWDTIPSAIYRAELLQTAYEFQNIDNVGAETVSTDGGFVRRPPLGLLDEVERLLRSYRRGDTVGFA